MEFTITTILAIIIWIVAFLILNQKGNKMDFRTPSKFEVIGFTAVWVVFIGILLFVPVSF
jgi:hypothetical protein